MKRLFTFSATVALAISAFAVPTKPVKKAAKKAPTTKTKAKSAAKVTRTPVRKIIPTPECPKCKMQMTSTKSLLKATPIKVKGVTYYCCTVCPSH